MTIAIVDSHRKRRVIAWYGPQPSDEDKMAFISRGFAIEQYSDAELHTEKIYANLAAVIFTQLNADSDKVLFRGLKKHAAKLLNHDCRLIVRLVNNGIPSLTRFLEQDLKLETTGLHSIDAARVRRNEPLPALPHIQIFDTAVTCAKISDFILEYPPSASAKLDLIIDIKDKGGKKIELSPDKCLLIGRAFYDCDEVHLTKEDEGNSGVSVFRAHVCKKETHFQLSQKLPMQWHLPYFLKIGERRKIFKEFQIYQEKVDPYIPFHLGPHLIPDRCCLGATSGLIVGDFVEESEPLITAAVDGRAAPAIACLFDRTLHGWHSYAIEESNQNRISNFLRNRLPTKIFPSRIARAKEIHPNIDEYQSLKALFETHCKNVSSMLIGQIHGDLHANNVRVRGSDAIAIDFFSHVDGPIILDVARLEASLLVDGFTHEYQRKPEAIQDIVGWLSSVGKLYDRACLHGAPAYIDPKDPIAWFHACVRKIRLYAWSTERERDKYALCLALALLEKSSKDGNALNPESTFRAAAYVFASRILTTSC